MKRLSAIILIICLCLASFTSCSENKEKKADDEIVQEAILDEFMRISEVPRESGQVKAISSYLRSWANENGLKAIRDKAYNVIIEKPASQGYEEAPLTILQCNMDMVTAVSDGVVYDPLNDSIKFENNGETITAKGTSLGSDSGIGIATALYILKSAVNHGPLRVIFTANAETNMSGSKGLDPKYLDGDYLINLDWEKDNSICIGSAGSYAFKMTRDITWTQPKNTVPYRIAITGLKGGNSGKAIDEGGANAIKVIGETLANIQGESILFELAGIIGGTSVDTIPTDAEAVIIINESDKKKFTTVFNKAADKFKEAYGNEERAYTFTALETTMPDKVVTLEDESAIISFIYGIVNGVQTHSENSSSLLDSSSNLGLISTASGDFSGEVYARSSSLEGAQEIIKSHQLIANMCDLTYNYKPVIPAWTAKDKENRKLVNTLTGIYKKQYNKSMKAVTTHTEYECGWFAEKNPDLEIVSIGPQVNAANSPEETLTIASISKPANLVMLFLEQNKPETAK